MTLTNYWWLLIWLFTGGVVLAALIPKKSERVLGTLEERWRIVPAVLLVLPYIIWAGYRSDNFGDTYAYREIFKEAPSSLSGLITYVENADKDKGFSVLTALIKSIVGNSDVIFFIVVATIQIVCIIYIYRKYSENYWLSIFLFVASTDYMSWVHNGMRQFLAVTITLVAMEFVVKEKYLKAVIFILIAFTFHASALFMLPMIFILQGKAWNKRTVLVLLAALIAILMIDRFTGIMETLLSDTQYSNAVTTWQESGDDGTSPLRVLVYSLPTILSLIGLKYIREEDNPMINVAVNASICSTGIFAISMFSSGIFVGRLPVYFFMLSQGILLPWEIENLFTKDSKKFVLVAAVLCYIAFFYYQMHITWKLI